MTISKIMLFKLFILFLLVSVSQSEYTTEWKKLGNEYENNDSIGSHGILFPRDNQTFHGYQDSKISFPTDGPSHQFKRIENDQESSNIKEDLLPKECGIDLPRRIIGGSKTDIDEFPWLCLLQYVNQSGHISHDCSGVLISKKYVLTAAHCTNGIGIKTRNMKLRKVRLGEWDTSTEKDCQGVVCSAPVQEIEVEKIIPHEKYKPRQKSQANDIALIRLRDEANLSQFVQPICLPFEETISTDYNEKKLTVSGWGRTSNAKDSSSNIKMKVDLPIVDWNRCRQFYQSFYGDIKIAKSQFCAGGESNKDSCQGDSGGPLMTTERIKNDVKWFVVGIVSSGPAACGVEGRPSLYTNVTQFKDWILDNIRD